MTKKFDDIEKNDPFKAPDGYFDSLEDRIMDRIEEEDRVFSIQPWLKYAAAAAVALLAIFFLIRTPGTEEGKSSEELLADVSDSAIVDYLSYSDISSYEILDNAEFTLTDADSIAQEELILPEIGDVEDIDLLIEEYSLIDLDNNSL